MSGDLRLSFHAWYGETTMETLGRAGTGAERRAVEGASQRLRDIVRSRELSPVRALRQTGPGKWLLIALFAAPAIAALVLLPLVSLAGPSSQAVGAGLVWLSFLPLLVLGSGQRRDPIRLRGRELPWWERRQGLIALLGLVVAVAFGVAGFFR